MTGSITAGTGPMSPLSELASQTGEFTVLSRQALLRQTSLFNGTRGKGYF